MQYRVVRETEPMSANDQLSWLEAVARKLGERIAKEGEPIDMMRLYEYALGRAAGFREAMEMVKTEGGIRHAA